MLATLGNKVVAGLSTAVAKASDHLAEYRTALPHIVADHSGRGLANWIHDRLWAHALVALDGIDNLFCIESGASRDIYIGLKFHVRFMRHSTTGAIRN